MGVGFIRDKLEIKFLILYIAARVSEPLPLEGMQELTMCDDGIDYFDYIRAIRSNPTAVRVKLADIAHNSDETRYAGCSEIDAEQLAARRKKYEKAKAILQAKNSSAT